MLEPKDHVDLSVKPDVKAFFDAETNTVSYIVKDPASSACAVIDSVMDIDYAAGRISYKAADEMIADIQARGLTVEWLIETHAHADHMPIPSAPESHVGRGFLGDLGEGSGRA